MTNLTQMERNKGEMIKKIITEKKEKLPSLANQDWKKVKLETEKVNKLFFKDNY